MSDWKQRAIDSYERQCEEAELQEAEHKAFRVEQAKENLIAALKVLNIPLSADAEIRVDDHEDDAELGALPYVTIEGVEFTFGPNGTGNHGGGGLGIVTTCPRCQQRVRGPYIFAESILGRELLNPERVDHVCETEEEKAEQSAIDARVDEHSSEPSAAVRYFAAMREMMREIADEQIQLRTGA